MADVTFATKGQAEILAAQEAVRQKALETKQEFEAGAKATGAWDAAVMKLKGQAEGALRSVATEQEKIVDQIAKIKEAQEKGLIPPAEAEEAVKRLRQEWINVDEATLKAAEAAEQTKKETAELAAEHGRLKSTAETALRSIQTEEERIVEQIEAIEAAMEEGLIPPDEAEPGIKKLRERLDEVEGSATKASKVFAKAFDPHDLLKWAAGFVSVKALIGEVRDEFEDLQTAVDRRIQLFLAPKERAKKLSTDVEDANKDAEQAEERVRTAKEQLAFARQTAEQQLREHDERRQEQERDLTKQLSQAESDLAEAQAKETRDAAEAAQRHQRQLEDAQRDAQRAREDLAKTHGDGRRGAVRQVDDAERRLQELQAAGSGREPSSAVRSLQRQIEELRSKLLDLTFDNEGRDVGSYINRERGSVAEMERDLAEARQRAALAVKTRDEFAASPEGRRFARINQRGEALDKLYEDLAEMSDETQLSTDELKKLADALRESGQGTLARKFMNFISSIDDGTISISDAVSQLREIQRVTRGTAVDGPEGIFGAEDSAYRFRTDAEMTAGERRQVELLEKAIIVLENIDRQSRDGGLPVTGE
jgi:hypothetical protein